jgi:hypothetical protein
VDDVELSPHTEGGRRGKGEDAGQRAWPPRWNMMEVYFGIVFVLDFISENVDLVVFGEARRQFNNVAAVPLHAAVIMNRESNFHVV